MLRKGTILGVVAAAVAAVFTAAALATAPVTHPYGDGAWVAGAGNGGGYGLVTTSDSSGSYGGATIKNFPTDPTAVKALSYDFASSQTGASGGSPRLVVAFSDGGNATLRPLSLTANTWQTENGMNGSDWDDAGGLCGYVYGTTWDTIEACHSGATITGMWVVNDSGWLYPSGLTVTLDNITVNDLVSGGPGNAK